MTWSPGETIVLRQVWRGRPLFAFPSVVVSDEPELLVTYLPEGAPFGAVPGWPGGDPHPWAHRGSWQGHGTLMLRRPGDRYLWCSDGVAWQRKDVEGVPRCVAEGRFDEAEAGRIRADADAFEAEYAREGPWWDLGWADWEPTEIPEAALPEGWELVSPA